jgi:hypothetical protein
MENLALLIKNKKVFPSDIHRYIKKAHPDHQFTSNHYKFTSLIKIIKGKNSFPYFTILKKAIKITIS